MVGRKNLFSKTDVKEAFQEKKEAIVYNGIVSNLSDDGLPILVLPEENFELPITGYQNQNTILILDHKEKININAIPVKLRKGKKSLNWFHEHYHFSSKDAAVLLRVLLKDYREGNFNNYNKFYAYEWLSVYLTQNNVTLIEFSLNDYDSILQAKLDSKLSRERIVAISKQLKNAIKLIPLISDSVKASIHSYIITNALDKPKESLSAEDRIKKSKLTHDYSDYVMFQIYAYVNACLSEIKEVTNRADELLYGFDEPDLFTREGLKRYRELIINNTAESHEIAFEMELLAYVRIESAHSLLINEHRHNYDISSLSKDILAFEYEKAYNSLPLDLKENPDVSYLLNNVLPIAIANNKGARDGIKYFGEKKAFIKIHQLLNRPFRNWSEVKNWHESLDVYKNRIANKYCCNWIFYGKPDDKSYIFSGRHKGIHNLLLGFTTHFDYLIMLLLLCESGRNREVALNIPAYVNNISVLKMYAPFATEPSCLLTGKKVRGHVNQGGAQEESIEIPTNSVLYEYLELFEKAKAKSNPNRELFIGNADEFRSSCIAYGENFRINCYLKDENGTLLNEFETSRFRKVWSGEILIEYLEGINTKDDLIKAIGEDLRNTIPLTYLLQSSKTEGMLTSAIVGLQLKFIENYQKIAAQLKTNGETPSGEREQRYLCDCSDPYNPDHNESYNTEYCNQFDMCLGCSRAVVYEEHIPRIIYRCFQYEQLLKNSPELYSSHYEVKHHLAREVIERFKSKSNNGQEKHSLAFNQAVRAWEDPETHLLPPIVHPKINIVEIK